MTVTIFTYPEQLHRALLQNIGPFHGVAGIHDHRSGSHLHYSGLVQNLCSQFI